MLRWLKVDERWLDRDNSTLSRSVSQSSQSCAHLACGFGAHGPGALLQFSSLSDLQIPTLPSPCPARDVLPPSHLHPCFSTTKPLCLNNDDARGSRYPHLDIRLLGPSSHIPTSTRQCYALDAFHSTPRPPARRRTCFQQSRRLDRLDTRTPQRNPHYLEGLGRKGSLPRRRIPTYRRPRRR